jgi:hypothetical protein
MTTPGVPLLTNVPVEAGHELQRAVRVRQQQVLVGAVLRAGGVGMWDPDGTAFRDRP